MHSVSMCFTHTVMIDQSLCTKSHCHCLSNTSNTTVEHMTSVNHISSVL